jgi:hypothetical protein
MHSEFVRAYIANAELEAKALENQDGSGIETILHDTRPKRPWSTVKQFCEEEKISRAAFYNMKAQGFAPRCVKLGTGKTSPIRIPGEEIERWRRQLLAEVK